MTAVRILCTTVFAVCFLGLSSAGTAQKKDKDKDKSDLKFELYKDKAGEFRWRLKAANGSILATPGQGYKAAADAKNSIELVKKSGTDDKMKYEVYEDDKQEHRWRLKAGNNQIVASSSAGYKAKADAEKAIMLVKEHAAKAEVVEVKD